MKKMWKHYGVILGIIIGSMFLSGCQKKEVVKDISMEVQFILEQFTSDFLYGLDRMPEENIEAMIVENQKQSNEVMVTALESWNNVKKDLGPIVTITDSKVSFKEDGFIVELMSVFKQRDMIFSMGVKEDLSEITFLSFHPVYTLVENMQQAGLNTVLGIGVVFVVLIVISLLIGCFKFIYLFENRRKDQKVMPQQESMNINKKEENLVDDLELVAVITAAIAASQNQPADELVVRSIKRVSSGKWKKS